MANLNTHMSEAKKPEQKAKPDPKLVEANVVPAKPEPNLNPFNDLALERKLNPNPLETVHPAADEPKGQSSKPDKPLGTEAGPNKQEKQAVVFQLKTGAAVEVMQEGKAVPAVGQSLVIGSKRYTVRKIEEVKLRDYKLVTIE